MFPKLEKTVSLVLFVIPIGLYVTTYSDDFEVFTFGGDVGPAFAPRVYCVVWVALAAVATWFAFRPNVDKDDQNNPVVKGGQLFYVMLIASASGYGMMTIGFVFSTVPGFFLFCRAFGYRKLVPLAIVSLAGPLGIWALFTFGFQLILPKSPWFHMI